MFLNHAVSLSLAMSAAVYKIPGNYHIWPPEVPSFLCIKRLTLAEERLRTVLLKLPNAASLQYSSSGRMGPSHKINFVSTS